MADPLKDAPTLCRQDLRKSSFTVTYPYLTINKATFSVPNLYPSDNKLKASFDLGPNDTVTKGMFGWDTAAEGTYKAMLEGYAKNIGLNIDQGSFSAKAKAVEGEARKYGEAALDILMQVIPDLYDPSNPETLGYPLDRSLDEISKYTPWTPGERLARNRVRHRIIEAYRLAARLIWCGLYGEAQWNAYSANRTEYEDALKDPTKIQANKNYKPIDYEITTANLPKLPEIQATINTAAFQDSENEESAEQETSEAGGSAGIAIAALVGIGALFLLTRK